MKIERYEQLMKNMELNLTQEECDNGWLNVLIENGEITYTDNKYYEGS